MALDEFVFYIYTFSDFFFVKSKLGLIIAKVHSVSEMPTIVLDSKLANSERGNLGDPFCFNLPRDKDKHIFSQALIFLDKLRRLNEKKKRFVSTYL